MITGSLRRRPKGPLYPSQRPAMFEKMSPSGRPGPGHDSAILANSEQRDSEKSDNNPVREKVLQYIREQKLMRAGDRVGVAVSGGADSVALLRVLLELREEIGIVLAVAHFNHGLRGAESDADQAFVAELARQSGLEFFAGLGDVRDHAVLNKLSVEAAGRELRYAVVRATGWLRSGWMQSRRRTRWTIRPRRCC